MGKGSIESLADTALVELTRKGNSAAFAELWKRHQPAGRAVAASFTSTFDPDDLVSEAFTKLFQAIMAGGGPTAAFRPYLFTTIRNTAAGWGRASREVPIADADLIEDQRFSEENTMLALDQTLSAKAFRSLPTRWQEALWYSEVENMPPHEIAPLLGMKANAVAALTYRAREGLRQAWIQAHIATVPDDSEHRWILDRLGAYARRGLGKRDTARMDEHLADCAKCSIVAAEAEHVGSRLALVLLPFVAGIGGALAFRVFLQDAPAATSYALGAGGVAAMPSAIAQMVGSGGVAGSAGAAGSGSVSGAGASAVGGSASALGAGGLSTAASVVVAAVSVVVVASVSAAFAFGPSLFDGTGSSRPLGSSAGPVVTPSTPVSSASAEAAPVTLPTPVPAPAILAPAPATPTRVPTPAGQPSPGSPAQAPVPSSGTSSPTIAQPAPPVVSAPVDAPLVTNAASLSFSGTAVPGSTIAIRTTPTGSLVGTVPVTSSGVWSVAVPTGGLVDATYLFGVSDELAGRSSPVISRSITLDRTAEPPAITQIDSGVAGQYFPIVSGNAEPGATVTVSDGTAAPVTVTADVTGAWTSPQLTGFTSGPSPLTVTQTDPAGNVSSASVPQMIDLAASPVLIGAASAGGFYVGIFGLAGQPVRVLTDGTATPSGAGVIPSWGLLTGWYPWAPSSGEHQISVRYQSGARFGPSTTIPVEFPGGVPDPTRAAG